MSAAWDHPLFSAVYHGREHDVRQRLKAGDSIHMPSAGLHDYGGAGQTILHVAVRERRLRMVKLLLDLGADPRRRSGFNGPNNAGWSPLGLLVQGWPTDMDIEWNAQRHGNKDDEGSIWAPPQHMDRIAQCLLDHDRGLALQAQPFGETVLSMAQRRAQDGVPGPLRCLTFYLVEHDRQVLNATLHQTPDVAGPPARSRL